MQLGFKHSPAIPVHSVLVLASYLPSSFELLMHPSFRFMKKSHSLWLGSLFRALRPFPFYTAVSILTLKYYYYY
jgi:hypothetical protein